MEYSDLEEEYNHAIDVLKGAGEFETMAGKECLTLLSTLFSRARVPFTRPITFTEGKENGEH